jgi:hypothetical protein
MNDKCRIAGLFKFATFLDRSYGPEKCNRASRFKTANVANISSLQSVNFKRRKMAISGP